MTADPVRPYKQKNYTYMDIKPGDTVNDFGCGPGVDTVHLAWVVGETGKVPRAEIIEKDAV